MKIVSTRKSLLIVIFLLLIIDVVILFFFVSKNRPEKQENKEPRQSSMFIMLTKEVNFDSGQMAKYQALRKEQLTALKPLFGGMRNSKDNFYSLLYQNELSDSLINIYSDSIALNQKKLDLHMFYYFKSIRDICSAEQLPKFDSSIQKVVMRMTGGRKGKGRTDAEKPNSTNHN